MTGTDAHHRALAAFVAEHRDQLEAYAGSDKKTGRLTEALLQWAHIETEAGEKLEVER